jgi:hypothetical protein
VPIDNSYANSNTNSDSAPTDTYTNCNTDTNSDSAPTDTYTNGNANTESDCNSNPNIDADFSVHCS